MAIKLTDKLIEKVNLAMGEKNRTRSCICAKALAGIPILCLATVTSQISTGCGHCTSSLEAR